MSLPFLRTLQGDRFFQLLILVGIGLSFFVPFAPKSWPAAIDWHTIITLKRPDAADQGVELSGYFDVLGAKWCAALLRSVGWRCLWCWRRRCFLPF
ncbi:hypothetical protein ACLB1N_04425 [Escherichia coli]